METEEVKKIKGMTDFANLFLAIYTLKTQEENSTIYLSRYFKTAINSVLNNVIYNIHMCERLYEYKLICDGDVKLDIEQFISSIKLSHVKKYWRNDYIYDLGRDCLAIEVENNDAQEEVKKYDKNSVNFVCYIVDCYIFVSKELDKLENKMLKELKYTY